MSERGARVLVLEGNPPELLAARYSAGLPGMAEAYGAALRCHMPELEVEILRPYFPDYTFDPSALEDVDGVVCTGSGVQWSADDARARPFWALFESAFLAGVPVLGSCWGLQVGAVVLGGAVEASPNGSELGIARCVRLTDAGEDHSLHAGRSMEFQALCIHRDEISAVPEGAIVTATNAHSAVQAMVSETGDHQFWGVQYHPEMNLMDMGLALNRVASTAWDDKASEINAMGADFRTLATEAGRSDLASRHSIGAEILDRSIHTTELQNWVTTKLMPVPA
ncbi:MAG: type 1 glutamine amidotransferase [Pseudomonadota bacterium]